jgi:hypothetical protein
MPGMKVEYRTSDFGRLEKFLIKVKEAELKAVHAAGGTSD